MNVYLVGTCGPRWLDLATRALLFIDARPFTFAAPEESGEPNPDLASAVESLVGLADHAIDMIEVASRQGGENVPQTFVTNDPTFIVGGLVDAERVDALTVRAAEGITRHDGGFPGVHVILLYMEGDAEGKHLALSATKGDRSSLVVRSIPLKALEEMRDILIEASESVSAETPLDLI